jgi:hypothetical protein
MEQCFPYQVNICLSLARTHTFTYIYILIKTLKT